MKLKTKFKKIVEMFMIFTILYYMMFNFITYGYTIEKETQTATTKIEKISNPSAGQGENDGLIAGGERETSYAWAMAARGNYLYIGTNKN